MAIAAIAGALQALPSLPTLPTGAGGAAAAAPTEFGNTLVRHLTELQATQADADTMAVQAATGDLTDVHDYTIAATRAALATELTTAVRDKAVAAFNTIMQMGV